jgi:hypothetical protein
MLKTLILNGLLVGALVGTTYAHSQALPTATAAGGSLQAGLGIAYAHPDYGQKDIGGVSGWADFDFTPHLGVEAAVHYVAFDTPTDIAENTYVVGPRYHMTYGRFSPYAKVVFGIANFVVQEQQDNPLAGNGTYLVYAFGGGVDVQATRHIIVRPIDFEYQSWPGFGKSALSPWVATIGAAWRFR